MIKDLLQNLLTRFSNSELGPTKIEDYHKASTRQSLRLSKCHIVIYTFLHFCKVIISNIF